MKFTVTRNVKFDQVCKDVKQYCERKGLLRKDEIVIGATISDANRRDDNIYVVFKFPVGKEPK